MKFSPAPALFSLAALSAMLVLPFLNPHHFNPIPTFFQEWTAALCGLLGAAILLRKQLIDRLEIPEIGLFPLGLTGILLLQSASGLTPSLPQALLFSLYLLWGLLMLILAHNLRRETTLEIIVGALAAAILCGALLSAILQALQLSGINPVVGLVSPLARGSGNLGQTNHLSNYLWLGIASAIFLYAERRINLALFIPCTLILLTSSSLTGSRSVLLYAAGLTALALWSAWHFKHPALRRIAHVALFLLPLTLLLQIFLTHNEWVGTLQANVSGERLFREASGTSQRLQLWRTGLAIFTEHPWLGAGIGQFPYYAYLTVGARPDGTYLGGGEHAHNLFIQLLSEFGVLALILAVILGGRWWLGFIRQEWRATHWWIAAILLILSTHSQLEYPLWYAFFLGIAALALGLGSPAGMRPRISSSGRWLIALALALGALTLTSLFIDYRRLEDTLYARNIGPDGHPPSTGNRLGELARLHRESLFAHYVPLSYAYQLSVDREVLKDKIAVCEMAIRFSPVDLVTFKLAYLLALDGRESDAKIALQRAVATHPNYVPTAAKQLDALVAHYPEIGWLNDELRRRAGKD